MRLRDNASEFYRYDFSLGLGYKPVKWLGLGASYNFIRDRKGEVVKTDTKKDGVTFNGYNIDHPFWRSKHRLSFDVSCKHSIGRFTFSVRERYQYTRTAATDTERDKFRDPAEFPDGKGPEDYPGQTYYPYNGFYFEEYSRVTDEKKGKDVHYLRSRFGVEYNIKGVPLNPYVTYEFSNNLGDAMKLEKQRLIVGTEWKITKRHRLDLAYLYDNGSDDDLDGDVHCITVGYKFKF